MEEAMIYIVCEDNIYQQDILKEAIKQYIHPSDTLITLYDGLSLLDYLSSVEVAIILLDIELGEGKNGIELALEINKISPSTQIIYVTAHGNEYIEEVYKTEHIWLLKKPVNNRKLKRALDKAQMQLTNKTLLLTQDGKDFVVDLNTVEYIEIRNHHAYFFLSNRGKFKHRISLSVLETLLPTKLFVRCHRSFIVNMSKIAYFSKNGIRMENYSDTINIGRKYKGVKKCIAEFWGDI